MRSIFIGSNGIRAGWRVLIFLALTAAMAMALRGVVLLFVHPPHHVGVHPLTPAFGILGDAPVFGVMLIAAYIMSRIERRPMGPYGLPLRGAFGGKFWLGALIGFASLGCVLGAIWAAHGMQLGTAPAGNTNLLAAGSVFLVSFLAVGFAEEYLFRGYIQSTLTQGIGFWPSALIMSALFALAHVSDSGESAGGIAQVAVFALVFCYILRVTGNLWFAVGYHMAWDWGETFFYGVPDSGQLASVSWLHSTFSGPVWLTGGSAGPEGSLLTTAALLLLVPVVTLLYRRTIVPML